MKSAESHRRVASARAEADATCSAILQSFVDDDDAEHGHLHLAMDAARVWGCATSPVAECQLSRCPKWLCRHGGQVLEADLFGASEPPSGWWAADFDERHIRAGRHYGAFPTNVRLHPRSVSAAIAVQRADGAIGTEHPQLKQASSDYASALPPVSTYR
jgi:hypothetical protein